MAIFKCKMCGGDLEVNEKMTIGTCNYCGSIMTLPKVSDEVTANLFNRANNLRLKSEFDKALEVYERILDGDNSSAEAHWGIVLCKYGIEYIEDPKTCNRIPTCHRTLYESVLADADYLSALENADASAKALYEEEAKRISELQKDILAVVKNEKPFDVFICYKETDENGKRTKDSALANDIYHNLTQEGYKVFYAAITLEDKLGQEYEPYIFAALNSAKVMLVVGTKPENFNSPWVKNEWSRFLHLMKKERGRTLIPCFAGMDAYDLPEDFAHLQAQDMTKIGFINDLTRGIKKIVIAEESKEIKIETPASSGSSFVAPLLKRAFICLENGEFKKADDLLEQVLNAEPENAKAYTGKLMAQLGVKNEEDLSENSETLDQYINYGNALRFADEEYRVRLKAYCQEIIDRLKSEHDEANYISALASKHNSCTVKHYIKCAESFRTISGYKGADEQAADCDKLAEEAHQALCLRFSNISKGRLIQFGTYGGIDIVWNVLDLDNGRALLISNKCLTHKPFDVKGETNQWESCSLRQWLNGEFYHNSFTPQEKDQITYANLLRDEVFLLNLEEIKKYFSGISERISYFNRSKCDWWLRESNYSNDHRALYINRFGLIRGNGFDVSNTYIAARPAIWVNLPSELKCYHQLQSVLN